MTGRLPKIGLKNYPQTRVSYSVFMIQTLIVNDKLLNLHAQIDQEFEKVINKARGRCCADAGDGGCPTDGL